MSRVEDERAEEKKKKDDGGRREGGRKVNVSFERILPQNPCTSARKPARRSVSIEKSQSILTSLFRG